MTYIELNQRLPELLLMRVDKIGMANSIEARVPFLDHKLISFAMSVPDSFKLRDGIGKEPVKRLAALSVPREEIYRPKTGFGAPIKQWFGGRMGEEFLALLDDPQIDARRYVQVPALRRVVHEKPRTVNEAFQLWVAYSFLAWRRHTLDDAADSARAHRAATTTAV
jgi:asparagine synthase (glutamine-hydrolysing)